MDIARIGYGPRRPCLYFDGDKDKYELFEVKFKARLRGLKLIDVLTRHDPVDGDVSGGNNRGAAVAEPEEYLEKNALVYAELVQCLDDKSLSLIIRDAEDDGRKSLNILRCHYLGDTKPRIISLYCELTSLKKGDSESVTEYVLRAEKAATYLKVAKEQVSDGLIIAMLLKGLPDSFKSFSTIITQRDDINLEQFKLLFALMKKMRRLGNPIS